MEKNTTPPELITKQELAKNCRCSVRTIDNWMRRGVIPYLKVNRAVRFQLARVLEALATYEINTK